MSQSILCRILQAHDESVCDILICAQCRALDKENCPQQAPPSLAESSGGNSWPCSGYYPSRYEDGRIGLEKDPFRFLSTFLEWLSPNI